MLGADFYTFFYTAGWDALGRTGPRRHATAGGGLAERGHASVRGVVGGLAAGCERLIRNYISGLAVPIPGALTFGRLLRVADDACQNVSGDPAQRLRVALQQSGVKVTDLHNLITDLFQLNTEYRIPAAHADVLEEAQWFAGRAAILLGGNAAITRIVNVLGL